MEDLSQRARSAIETAVADRPEGEQLFVHAYVQRVLADVDPEHPEQTLEQLQEENKRLKARKATREAAKSSAADKSKAGGKAHAAARDPPEPDDPYRIDEPKAPPPTEATEATEAVDDQAPAQAPEQQAVEPSGEQPEPEQPEPEQEPEQPEPEMMCFPLERTLLEPIPNARFSFAIVGFTVPGGPLVNTDHDKNKRRYDSTPLANGIIRAGGAVEIIDYVPEHTDFLETHLQQHDGIIFRLDREYVSEAGIT